jgi:hypothetical protein
VKNRIAGGKTMNIGMIRQNTLGKIPQTDRQNKDQAAISFEEEGRRMNHTAFNKDDLLNQFWNMTNSMPKDNQISLAASVTASKVFDQGITAETTNFLKTLSRRFSPEDIGSLKNEIRNHPMIKNKSSEDIEKFINEFDAFISSQQTGQTETLQKQQANPKFRTPEELFFQTTFLPKTLFEEGSAV